MVDRLCILRLPHSTGHFEYSQVKHHITVTCTHTENLMETLTLFHFELNYNKECFLRCIADGKQKLLLNCFYVNFKMFFYNPIIIFYEKIIVLNS